MPSRSRPEVDEQRLLFREAYAELFVDLLDEGVRGGEFRVEQVSLVAACLVGAIAEALVGPLSPPARGGSRCQPAGRGPGQRQPSPITFCLRAVGAPSPEMSLQQFAETHEVFNQVPSLDGANLARVDLPLQE